MALFAPRRAAPGPDAVAPDGSEIRYLAASGEGAARASLVEASLPAGSVSQAVRHRTVEETWYIVEGSGKVWRSMGSEARIDAVSAGDALVIPTGAAFQFSAGPSGMRILCNTVPPWPGPAEALSAGEGGLGPATRPAPGPE